MLAPLPSPAPDKQLCLRLLTMPENTNPSGIIFGGWIMAQTDIAGATLAVTAARSRVSTVAVRDFEFLAPIHVGDYVNFLRQHYPYRPFIYDRTRSGFCAAAAVYRALSTRRSSHLDLCARGGRWKISSTARKIPTFSILITWGYVFNTPALTPRTGHSWFFA